MSNRPFDVDDVERLVRLGPKELTWPEVCARAEISHEVADPLWRALGFPDDRRTSRHTPRMTCVR
jgi:hypothetical protein